MLNLYLWFAAHLLFDAPIVSGQVCGHIPIPRAGVREVKGRRGYRGHWQVQREGRAPLCVVRKSLAYRVNDWGGTPPDMSEEKEESA